MKTHRTQYIVILTLCNHYDYSERIQRKISNRKRHVGRSLVKTRSKFSASSPGRVTQDRLKFSSNQCDDTCGMLSTRETHSRLSTPGEEEGVEVWGQWRTGSVLQSKGSQRVKHDLVTGQQQALEKEMATHSSVLAWKIPWTEEPVGLQSMGSQRVRHNQANEHTGMRAFRVFTQD